MQKVLLAIGSIDMENFLKKKLSANFKFVDSLSYKEAVTKAVAKHKPDVLVIRETLPGHEDVLKIIYSIRNEFPSTRIIFISSQREIGDGVLSTLVSYGVYDLIIGNSIQAFDLIELIKTPNSYADVKQFQPVPKLNGDKRTVSFEAPDPIVVEKEVVKEVFVEDDDEGFEPITDKDERESPRRKVDTSTSFEQSNTSENPDKVVNSEEDSKTKEKVNPFKTSILGSIKKKTDKGDTENHDEEKQPKIKKPVINKKRKMVEDRLAPNMNVGKGQGTSRQKILTFMGGRRGVGTSTISSNIAFELAGQGHKVLYVEMEDRFPSVNYWFNVGQLTKGLDTAIQAIESGEYSEITSAITKSKELKKLDGPMQDSHDKYPDNLDFMFFSESYLTRNQVNQIEDDFDLSKVKDLFMYLLFQEGYDYIILDAPSDVRNLMTLNSLLFSNEVFLCIDQDVATISSSIQILNQLRKSKIDITHKLHLLVNNFNKGSLSQKKIEDWMELNTKTILIPSARGEILNSTYLGVPCVFNKKSAIKKSINSIIKSI